MKERRICLECAEGGHLDEMLELLPAVSTYDFFFVTTRAKTTENLAKGHEIHFIREMDLRKRNKASLIMRELARAVIVLGRIAVLFVRERPWLVISTGGSATIQAFVVGKLVRAKTVYVQSVTRVDSLSFTGKVVYFISDTFLVQWMSLVDRYPKAEYWGRVL